MSIAGGEEGVGLKIGNGFSSSEDDFLRGWVNCQMPTPYFLPENTVLGIRAQVIMLTDLCSNSDPTLPLRLERRQKKKTWAKTEEDKGCMNHLHVKSFI